MTLRKNITQTLAVSFMAVTLVMAAALSYAAYADVACVNGGTADIDDNMIVNGKCVYRGNIDGNVIVNDNDLVGLEQFGYSGAVGKILNGNMEGKDSDIMNLNRGTMNGNIVADGVRSVQVNGDLNGNVETKDVSGLVVKGTISSDVKAENTRVTLINATVAGSVEVKGPAATSNINMRDGINVGNVEAKDGANIKIEGFLGDNAATSIFGNVVLSGGGKLDINTSAFGTTIFGNVDYSGPPASCTIETGVLIFGNDPRVTGVCTTS